MLTAQEIEDWMRDDPRHPDFIAARDAMLGIGATLEAPASGCVLHLIAGAALALAEDAVRHFVKSTNWNCEPSWRAGHWARHAFDPKHIADLARVYRD